MTINVSIDGRFLDQNRIRRRSWPHSLPSSPNPSCHWENCTLSSSPIVLQALTGTPFLCHPPAAPSCEPLAAASRCCSATAMGRRGEEGVRCLPPLWEEITALLIPRKGIFKASPSPLCKRTQRARVSSRSRLFSAGIAAEGISPSGAVCVTFWVCDSCSLAFHASKEKRLNWVNGIVMIGVNPGRSRAKIQVICLSEKESSNAQGADSWRQGLKLQALTD